MEMFIKFTIGLSIVIGSAYAWDIGSLVPLLFATGAGGMICLVVMIIESYFKVFVECIADLLGAHDDYIP